MSNENWDPAVGMSEDQKEFQKSNQRNLLFVVIFGFGGLMAFFVSIAILLPKLKLQKINETAVLEKLIKETYEGDFTNLFEFNKILNHPYVNNKINEIYTTPPKEHEKVFQTFCGT